MKISLNWINELLTKSLTISQIKNAFDDLHLEIDEIRKIAGNKFKVVKILKIRSHGDRLKICTILDENKEIELICGAENVKENFYAILAEEGAVLWQEQIIKEKKILGFSSKGMLLSYEELGINSMNSEGIILEEKKEFLEFLVKEDYVITLNLSANRNDLNSIRSIAEELACYFKISLKDLENRLISQKQKNIINNFPIEINSSLLENYASILIENISINNNYLYFLSLLIKVYKIQKIPILNMLQFLQIEMGISLHMYDRNSIEKIKIDILNKQEEFITLNNEKILLKENDIVAIDEKTNSILAVTGIIGGNKKITEFTNSVLIEAAILKKDYIIPTIRRLGINNFSTYIFSRSINYKNYLRILDFLNLVFIGNFSEIKFFTNYFIEEKKIFLSYDYFYKTTNISISLNEISKILNQFNYRNQIITKSIPDSVQDEVGIEVTIDCNKLFIHTVGNLVEEILRIGNFHKLLKKEKEEENLKIFSSGFYDIIWNLKTYLIHKGYKEVKTLSFVEQGEIEILNPIHQEKKYLRSSLKEHIVDHLITIYREKLTLEDYTKIFEISKVFFLKENKIQEFTNCILGIVKNNNIYNAISEENEIKIFIDEFSQLFSIKIEILDNLDLKINGEISGKIFIENSFIILEIFNLEKILKKNSSLKLKKNSLINNYYIRDYSFATSIKNFLNIYKKLESLKNISFKLFDKYENCFGIRIKFYSLSIEEEILKIFKEFNVEIR